MLDCNEDSNPTKKTTRDYNLQIYAKAYRACNFIANPDFLEYLAIIPTSYI